MTSETVAAISPEVMAVRRWARVTFWSLLIVLAAAFVVVVAVPPTNADVVLDVGLVAVEAFFLALEILLLLAIFKLFRRSNPAMTSFTVAFGLASALAGIAASLLDLVRNAPLYTVAISIGSVLTAAELTVFGLLLRAAAARPRGLWLLAVIAAFGAGASVSYEIAPESLLLPLGLLLLAFPLFLFRLGNLEVPPRVEPIHP